MTRANTRRDGVEPTKRRVPEHLIIHPDCPLAESTNNPITQCATGSSCESDKTAVEDEAPTRLDAGKEGETTPLAKPVEETLRPTVRLVSKPLPDLRTSDSVTSRWSVSTSSVYSDDDSFSYTKVLDMFPEPPKGTPNLDRFDDWENSSSLSTSPAFTSSSDTSSSSIATITPTAARDSSVKPLVLGVVQKLEVVTVVNQIPRANCSYTQLQDSVVTRSGCAYPHGSTKDSIQTSSIGPTSTGSTLRRRPSSLTPSQNQTPPRRIRNIEALVWPYRHQTAEDIERIEREQLERDRKYQIEQEKEQERKLFETEFGYNPWYKGKKTYEREVDPNKFESIRHGKEKGWNWL